MDQTAATRSPVPAAGVARAGLVLAAVCGAQFMVVVDDTVVNAALPSILKDLNFTNASLAWVVDAYLLLFGGFLLVGGRCADLFGRRRVFLAGMAVFAAASLAAGLAQNSEAIIIARGVQGFGAALLSPAALSILLATFQDPEQRRRALGVWAGLVGISGASGVLLGGVITDQVGWRWVFFINVPASLLIAALTLRAVPARQAQHEGARSLDGLGAALITAGLLLLVYTVISTDHRSWTSPATIGGLVGAAVLIAAFVLRELRTPAPLVRLGLLRRREIAVANAAVILAASALFAFFFFLTLYMRTAHGWSAMRTGVSWVPFGLTLATFSGISVRLVPKLGGRTLIVAGLLLTTGANLLLLRITPTGSYATQLLPTLLLAGAGFGLALVPMVVAAVSGVDPSESGVASGLVSTAQQVGGAIGLAALATLASSQLSERLRETGDPVQSLVDAFHSAFLAGAVLTFCAALLSLLLPALRTEVDLAAIQGA